MTHAHRWLGSTTGAIAALVLGATAGHAENLTHLSQLLSTRSCSRCDLSNAGLVLANLSGVNLVGANLRNANLSRADLSGADLRGADLSGASLYGANLEGARLEGATLYGTDLREAYFQGSDIARVDISTAYIQGSTGLPVESLSPVEHYRYGIEEFKGGDYQRAISDFSRALTLDPGFAPAYMGRAVARYRAGDEPGARVDTHRAAEIYLQREDEAGFASTQEFLAYMTRPYLPPDVQDSGGDFGSAVAGIGQLLLQFIPQIPGIGLF